MTAPLNLNAIRERAEKATPTAPHYSSRTIQSAEQALHALSTMSRDDVPMLLVRHVLSLHLDAVDATLSDVPALIAEVERLRAALKWLGDMACPDQPATSPDDDRGWILRHVGAMRRYARAALGDAP